MFVLYCSYWCYSRSADNELVSYARDIVLWQCTGQRLYQPSLLPVALQVNCCVTLMSWFLWEVLHWSCWKCVSAETRLRFLFIFAFIAVYITCKALWFLQCNGCLPCCPCRGWHGEFGSLLHRFSVIQVETNAAALKALVADTWQNRWHISQVADQSGTQSICSPHSQLV